MGRGAKSEDKISQQGRKGHKEGFFVPDLGGLCCLVVHFFFGPLREISLSLVAAPRLCGLAVKIVCE
jgi:hypothetical protein